MTITVAQTNSSASPFPPAFCAVLRDWVMLTFAHHSDTLFSLRHKTHIAPCLGYHHLISNVSDLTFMALIYIFRNAASLSTFWLILSHILSSKYNSKEFNAFTRISPPSFLGIYYSLYCRNTPTVSVY